MSEIEWAKVQRKLARLPELDAVSCNRHVQEIWAMLRPAMEPWCGCEEYPCAHTQMASISALWAGGAALAKRNCDSADPLTVGRYVGDLEVALEAMRRSRQTEIPRVVTAYEPCQGADEQTEIHERYCVPFYEWRRLVGDLPTAPAAGHPPATTLVPGDGSEGEACNPSRPRVPPTTAIAEENRNA